MERGVWKGTVEVKLIRLNSSAVIADKPAVLSGWEIWGTNLVHRIAPVDLPPRLGPRRSRIFRLGLSVERQRGDRKSLERCRGGFHQELRG